MGEIICISDVIKKLEELKEKHGDLQVVNSWGNDLYEENLDDIFYVHGDDEDCLMIETDEES